MNIFTLLLCTLLSVSSRHQKLTQRAIQMLDNVYTQNPDMSLEAYGHYIRKQLDMRDVQCMIASGVLCPGMNPIWWIFPPVTGSSQLFLCSMNWNIPPTSKLSDYTVRNRLQENVWKPEVLYWRRLVVQTCCVSPKTIWIIRLQREQQRCPQMTVVSLFAKMMNEWWCGDARENGLLHLMWSKLIYLLLVGVGWYLVR